MIMFTDMTCAHLHRGELAPDGAGRLPECIGLQWLRIRHIILLIFPLWQPLPLLRISSEQANSEASYDQSLRGYAGCQQLLRRGPDGVLPRFVLSCSVSQIFATNMCRALRVWHPG